MEARPFDGHAERRSDHPRLRALVAAVDDRLRLRHGVIEYTCCPDCIFRLQVGRSSREVMLSDGLRVRLGDPVINLHLWNEHIPRFPAAGPTLVWARSIRHSLDISLRELAVYLSARHELDNMPRFAPT